MFLPLFRGFPGKCSPWPPELRPTATAAASPACRSPRARGCRTRSAAQQNIFVVNNARYFETDHQLLLTLNTITIRRMFMTKTISWKRMKFQKKMILIMVALARLKGQQTLVKYVHFSKNENRKYKNCFVGWLE